MKWKTVGAVVLIAMLVMTTVPVMTKATDTPTVNTQNGEAKKVKITVCVGEFDIRVDSKGNVNLYAKGYNIKTIKKSVEVGTEVTILTTVKVKVVDHFTEAHSYEYKIGDKTYSKNVREAKRLLMKLWRLIIGHRSKSEITLQEETFTVENTVGKTMTGSATIVVNGFGCHEGLKDTLSWRYCVDINAERQ
ncbi:MAG: hypothetical protein DRN25_06895 [Thermoplasmata archaeon]|nr:MAG: hypothetical protein DRN25_06895 [Thermoplasmata archaeon]